MVIEVVVLVQHVKKRSPAGVYQHVAHIRVERGHLGSGFCLVFKMSVTGGAQKTRPRHRSKAGNLATLSAEQAGEVTDALRAVLAGRDRVTAGSARERD